ncbi:MAG TPA: HAMP domain-containing sensor histidine kinase [Candidatus Binatia bacterium]|nr:HAMP domain-containing sensor histidine kinase [Candidatus Binatia bacterium]
MRRPAIVLVLIAPAAILFFFWLRPDLDTAIRVPVLHFYVVTFTSLSATVVSFLLIVALGSVARPRHVLAAVAFAVMGTLFSIHGLTTPGAIIPATHPAVPAVSWSAWLTLFSGGVIFAIAGMDRPQGLSPRFLIHFIIAAAVGVMLYISVVLTVPQWLGAIEANAAPWHRRLLFIFSFGVWLLAAIQLFRTWRETRQPIDGTLTLVAGLLAQSTVSMHVFPLWNLSWWLYHLLLLGSFLLTATILFSAYEHAREFRLVRYFLAASAILTVLLALVASFLFSEFAEHVLTTMGSSAASAAVSGYGLDTTDVTEAVMRARSTGLLIATVTMGVLFTVLLLVVRRADAIITARSKQLAVALRDLRQAEVMRDDLTHMIVHDLRTPLTAILTSLGLLKRLPPDASGENRVRIVDRTVSAAQRLDKMIDEILMVSKMEKGELHPRREPVSLPQLLAQQLDPYYLQATAEDKTLDVACAEELQASIDPMLTGRVLENLLSNAFKYTSRGGHITVSAQGQNGVLTMHVRDDGEGIPDAYKEQIFGKFNRVPEMAGRPVRKGTGLGLAFCRLAVEAHGGTIWVQDAPGGGSEFIMKMPRE